MSRIGRLPVEIPSGVQVDVKGLNVRVKGPKGELQRAFSPLVEIKMEPPAGISFETDLKTRQIKVLGFDKELVGQVAANIRKVRPPEPYHGKGLHYLGEHIRHKAGKAGKGAAAK